MASRSISKQTESPEFFYPPDVPDGFKKAIGVVQVAMGRLGLLHRKIYNVMLANAYEGLGLGHQRFSIQVSSLAELAGFDSRDYQLLYDYCKDLMETTVEFIEFDNRGDKARRPRRRRGGTTLIADFSVSESGLVTYSYSHEMAKKLFEPEQYIWMALSVQNRFSSKYELNLFENCIRYVGVGSTGFKDVEDWRDLLGANEETYDEFKRLNAMVIKPAIDGVNNKSGIIVDPEFEREKRRVARIRFNVRENPQMSLLDHEKHSRIRQSNAYAAARELGLKDVEALHWIEAKGEAYVLDAVEYVRSKKPENPAGYLVAALRKGFGERTDAEREEVTKRQLALEDSRTRRAETRATFEKALELRYWQDQLRTAQREQDREIRRQLKEATDQEALREAVIAVLGEERMRREDFEKNGWDSMLCGAAFRRAAAERFGLTLIEEETWLSERLTSIAESRAALETISQSVYRQKLEDAALSIGTRKRVDFSKVAGAHV
ncbi:MAG: replication initiation protein [Rhizobiaceae bacterium]